MAASSESTLKKIKNIPSIFNLARFAVHNRKLSQEMCLRPAYYTWLCKGRSTKETTDSFFRRVLNGKS